jgi:hypothetical protein
MARPNANAEWAKDAYHYQVKIYQDAPEGSDDLDTRHFERKRFELVTFYSKGPGLRPIPPSLEEVLDSLRMDWLLAHQSFNVFCELGYDPDSRKAYAIYEACVNIGRQVEQLLDRNALNELSNIEPL